MVPSSTLFIRMEDVTGFVRLKQEDEKRQLASELLQLRADQSEAGLSVRDRKILDLTDRLHAADAAQFDLKNSQLVKQAEQLREANASLRELTARLMQIQDEERRRIARELHDSIGQMLVAQGMYLSSVAAESHSLSAAAVRALTDSTALIEQMSRELRTTSYLLHPPLLEEAGLASAIRWYADGFAERSKITVKLELTADLGRLTNEFEIALFRIVQECLTNIHRHSGSSFASIRLARSATGITLEVQDTGVGIPVERRDKSRSGSLPGVGIRGMRERIAQLGGVIQINTGSCGTVITAHLPSPPARCPA